MILEETDNIAVLREAANNYRYEYRMNVAQNPNCPLDLLNVLIHDPSEVVRRAACLNEKCTSSMLEVLSNDKRYNIRAIVATHDKTPIYILEKLINDKDDILTYLVRNKNCTQKNT